MFNLKHESQGSSNQRRVTLSKNLQNELNMRDDDGINVDSQVEVISLITLNQDLKCMLDKIDFAIQRISREMLRSKVRTLDIIEELKIRKEKELNIRKDKDQQLRATEKKKDIGDNQHVVNIDKQDTKKQMKKKKSKQIKKQVLLKKMLIRYNL